MKKMNKIELLALSRAIRNKLDSNKRDFCTDIFKKYSDLLYDTLFERTDSIGKRYIEACQEYSLVEEKLTKHGARLPSIYSPDTSKQKSIVSNIMNNLYVNFTASYRIKSEKEILDDLLIQQSQGVDVYNNYLSTQIKEQKKSFQFADRQILRCIKNDFKLTTKKSK